MLSTLVIKYENNQVRKRVVTIVNCKSNNEKYMYELVSNEIYKLNIIITKFIENSTGVLPTFRLNIMESCSD